MVGKNVGALFSNLNKNGVLRKRKSRYESDDDDLSDIPDAEIAEYINNDTEMLFKKLVWEAMNKDYTKSYFSYSTFTSVTLHLTLKLVSQRKPRNPAMEKKSSSAKKAVGKRLEKGKGEDKENKKRLSSKINYDALKKLTGELEEVAENAKENDNDSNQSKQVETEQSNGTSSPDVGLASDDENYNDEFEPDDANIFSYGYDEEEEQCDYWD
ncbi:Brf1-like TBP-binding protein [Corchorus olitorius]|uniref:Brf1-like TBP-binding protein n=1 Tax=Corchorus olitorius TaxID=93759 RepID=A0A1R3H6I4_9ROSI|nr:Brf1-like TBP-binding protein [Corchorus olitorius]